MDDNVTLLAIDDDALILELIEAALSQPQLEILKESDPIRAIEIIRERHPDIVVLDLVMPNLGGMELLDRIVELSPGIDVVLLTGHYSPESAVDAIRRGACDYLTKPFKVELLRERIGNLVAAAQNRRRAEKLESELFEASRFGGMIGGSPAILEAFSALGRIAPHYRTALIAGQTGTGKQLAAEVLQRLSPVGNKPFVICNCAAIVESLFESELFGHVRGAFTGAFQDRIGMFEAADGGTIFLDEIGEIPLSVQGKLLRALQQQEIQRVGSPKVKKIDVRVIAATNRELRAMVQEKQFREDLYYRLAMVEIRLPTLSERKEDLPLLEKYFVELFSKQYNKQVKGLTRRAQAVLSRHTWPGNVRELENVIGRACMMTSSDAIDVRDLPEYLRAQNNEGTFGGPGLLTLAEVERRHVEYVLDQVGGNKLEAAAILGIARATLYRILNRELEDHASQS
jgi:DNA-binding NtrC family response regulator